MIEISRDRFEELVADALDLLPADLLEMIDNVVVVVEDDPPEDEPDLFGLYEGTPLTERGDYGFMELPDRIQIFRNPLCRMAQSNAEVVAEVRITVIHEVAHHFGIDDDALTELGWD